MISRSTGLSADEIEYIVISGIQRNQLNVKIDSYAGIIEENKMDKETKEVVEKSKKIAAEAFIGVIGLVLKKETGL